MSQTSYCQYCSNHIFAYRSDLTPDLVHHTMENIKPRSLNATTAPGQAEGCGPDLEACPTSSQQDLSPVDLSSDPDWLPRESLGCNCVPAQGT